MTKLLSAIVVFVSVPMFGFSQVGPVQTPYPYLPNFYNRTTQPLSPYLNILRGQNSGVNYYYGVGTPQSGQIRAPLAGSPFVYQYAPFPSDSGQLQPSRGYVLPPAGHANSYGNYFGIAGSGMPGYGGVRPNQSTLNPGVANTRPQANTTGNRRP